MLKEQFHTISKLLPKETQYYKSRTDNHRIHEKTKYSKDEILNKLNSQYSNYKIEPILNKTDVLFVLDYDDHNGEMKIDDLKEIRDKIKNFYNLSDSLIIKTPSGNGFQEWFLIDKEVLNSQIKKNFFFYIEITENNKQIKLEVEAKTCQNGYNITFEGPGSFREKDKHKQYYKVIKELPLSHISEEFISYLKGKSNNEFDSIKNIINSINSDEHLDKKASKSKAKQKITDKCSDFLFGNKMLSGRNNFLYQCAMDVFVYGISLEEGKDILLVLQNYVFQEKIDEYSFNATVKSAFNRIKDARRSTEGLVHEILKPFQYNQGNKKISRKEYSKKVEFLSKLEHNKMLNNRDTRRAFCEVLIKTDSHIYVPNILSKDSFKNIFNAEYENYINGSNPRFSVLFGSLQKCSLYWKEVRYSEFNNNYVFDGGKRKSLLTATKDFINYSHTVDVINEHPESSKDDFIILEKTCNIGSNYDPEMMKFENDNYINEELNFFHNVFKRALTDRNKEKEYDFLLDRISVVLQKPSINIDNVICLKGMQGIGKTAFYNFISALFNQRDVGIYPNFESFSNLHEEPKVLSLIEEVNLDTHPNSIKVWDKIKAISTSDTQYINKKFVQSTCVSRAVNIFLTTNNDPNNLSIIRDRRLTIMNSPDPKTGESIKIEIKRIVKFLLGTPGNELIGLKALYKSLNERKLQYDYWNFNSEYQNRLIMDLSISSEHLSCLLNYIANLGIVGNLKERYPLLLEEEIEAKELDDKFITNRFDHIIALKYFYSNPIEHRGKLFSLKQIHLRNIRIRSWLGEDMYTKLLLDNCTDPNRRNTSNLLKENKVTFTMVYPSIERLLLLLTENISVYRLEDYIEFIHNVKRNDSEFPIREQCIKFLETKFPEDESGYINYMNYIGGEINDF